jgi:hypothetical protein
MYTAKTLALAAATVLSLGAGVVMVQGEVPSAGEGAYFSGQHQTAPQTVKNGSARVQSGTSDIDTTGPRSPYSGAHTGLFRFDS